MPTPEPPPSHPKFRFRVRVGSAEMGFSEISGLSLDAKPLEYRPGQRAGFSPVKIASIEKSGVVILTRGVLRDDPAVLRWLRKAGGASVERKTVTVMLLDEGANPTQTWTLTAAFPTKFASADLKASGNDVPVSTLELSYDGLTVDSS